MKRLFSLFVSALCAVGAWAALPPASYEYVDLGLSVKWATCNLGATTSTGAGYYLAWGETSPKSEYTWETYLSEIGGAMSKWVDAGSPEKDPLWYYVSGGPYCSLGIGETEYDAAKVFLGTNYRMPTLLEFKELENQVNCSWEWYEKDNDEFNGVAGYKVTSKKAGYTDKYIFLPAAGCCFKENLSDEGSVGYYWSSTPDPKSAYCALDLYFSSTKIRTDTFGGRNYGYPVRPVYEDKGQAAYDYLVSLIGEKQYSLFTYRIFVDEEGVIEVSEMGEGVALTVSELTVSGNEFKFQAVGLKFVVEEGAISHIYMMEGDNVRDEFTEGSEGAALEEELAVLMSDNVYVGQRYSFFASEGYLMFEEEGMSAPMPLVLWSGSFVKTDGSYIYEAENDFDIVFPVEDGEVNAIEIYSSGYQIDILAKQSTTPICQVTIDGNTKEYFDIVNLLRIISGINDKATIKLLDDINLSESASLYFKNKNTDVTLDLNGHTIKGNCEDGILYVADAKLTIEGKGVVENTRAQGVALGVDGTVVVRGGTYIGLAAVCYVSEECELIISGGKFKAPTLYYEDEWTIRPIVKGGIFSMNPSDCVAEGYEVVENDDEDTMGVYPYMVVEKTLIPTGINGVNADKKQKAVKTIENGRVVVICGDEKYDMAGRKL